MNRSEFASRPSDKRWTAARNSFLRDGSIDSSVPQTVRESWLRCRTLGVDPRSLRQQTAIQASLENATAGSRALLQAAERPLEIVHRVWRDEPHLVVLSDPNGILIRLFKPDVDRKDGRFINIIEGASWAEAAIGTNAIGTAIATQKPTYIAGSQHYSDAFTPWTCVGIPIQGPNGQLAGAIDLSVRGDLANVYAWDLMYSVAEAIEAEMRRIWPVNGINANPLQSPNDPIATVHAIFDVLMNHQSSGKFDADMVQDVRHRLDEAENGIRATVRELSESQARFEQWDRRRDDALANLSHELKNPINVVSMLIELIERKQEDPGVLREITPRLRHQARRLARLVDDINDLSRVKQGTLAFQDQSVELNGTLKTALESIRVEAHEKQQSVVLRLTSRPLIVRGDPDRIEQILTNILSNAIKYTPPGGSIFLESEADAGDAIVRIRDTGCGISSEHLETIFDEFTRIIPSFGDPGEWASG